MFMTVNQCVCKGQCEVHCLSFSDRWMLSGHVILDALGRFESHGTGGAFVKGVAVGLLDVGLDRVQATKHHQATRTSSRREKQI